MSDRPAPIPDKRDMAGEFRARLTLLLTRAGLNRSAFAAQAGIDRSALTHMLSPGAARLPRAETLARIAAAHSVSLDWLLGVAQDENVSAQITTALKLEETQEGKDEALLAGWHREAAGSKIRYVPSTVPDLLRSDAIIRHLSAAKARSLTSQIDTTHDLLKTQRKLEADMEVCMPLQTLESLAAGDGIWNGLPPDDRRQQLDRIARLADELYPRFRLYLFDGRARFCSPYTVFGTKRAALYVGDLYLVLNTSDAVGRLTAHFDDLVRGTRIHAHESADWVGALSSRLFT
jgi:transcriptional regulator with XRE-family HTH domain